uniref:Uncharacterized protein n=1 Tax=Anguilla anguilla TaxID=7936 RepID=A0A0E9R806_ANGAN
MKSLKHTSYCITQHGASRLIASYCPYFADVARHFSPSPL